MNLPGKNNLETAHALYLCKCRIEEKISDYICNDLQSVEDISKKDSLEFIKHYYVNFYGKDPVNDKISGIFGFAGNKETRRYRIEFLNRIISELRS